MPMSKKGTWLAMRGRSDETLVFFFNREGLNIGQDTYANWLACIGPELKPGQTVECTCTEGAIHLDCPIHAVDMGPDFEGL